MVNDITVIAPVTTRSGYGARSRDVVIALIDAGHNVKVLPTPWGNTPQDALEENNPVHQKILSRLVPNIATKPEILIQITIPSEFQPIGKYNIGITAGIETDTCRPEWIEGCNRMDLVLTSSTHSMEVFKNFKPVDQIDPKTKMKVGTLRLISPVRVLFEGLDLDLYNKTNIINKTVADFMSNVSEDFCFLFVGHWLQGNLGADRKDVGMLAKLFANVFKQKPINKRPALILKTSGAGFSIPDLDQIQSKLDLILAEFDKHPPNIYILHGDLTDQEMNSLYNHPKIKAMVSLTHGEGFGRPLLEFTLTGKPVIAPNWSGQKDFLIPEHSLLIGGMLTEVDQSAVNEWIVKGSKWFTANYLEAGNAMLSVHDQYDKYLEVTRKHAKPSRDNFSIQKMGELLGSYINDLLSGNLKTENLDVVVDLKKNNDGQPFSLPKLKKI